MIKNIKALILYRRILRLHKKKLDIQQLYLGNSYVKEEFRLNKKANERQADQFMIEWGKYAEILTQQKEIIGKELNMEELENLSPEQKSKLQSLQQETESFKKNIKNS